MAYGLRTQFSGINIATEYCIEYHIYSFLEYYIFNTQNYILFQIPAAGLFLKFRKFQPGYSFTCIFIKKSVNLLTKMGM